MQQSHSTEAFRPIVYVSLTDPAVRARVVAILERAGWMVLLEPTGVHVLRAIADVIDGSRSWLRPRLIVIDAYAPGCAGTTIALGLRDLGIKIPIVLALRPGQPAPPASADHMLYIVDAAAVDRAVAELAHAAIVPAAASAPSAPHARVPLRSQARHAAASLADAPHCSHATSSASIDASQSSQR